MKRLALVSALCLLVCFSLTAGSKAATLNVPGDYATVQAAIDAAVAGDEIVIAAGTWTENITINKTLTLKGAQAGIDARGRTGSETILTCASGHLVTVAAVDVVLDGLTMTGTAAAGRLGNCDSHGSGFEMRNCVMDGVAQRGFWFNVTSPDIVLEYNVFDAALWTDSYSVAHFDGSDVFNDLYIGNNEFTGGSIFAGNVTFNSSGFQLVDNLFDGCSMNLASAFENATVSGNIFRNNGYTNMQAAFKNSTISYNQFEATGPSPYAGYPSACLQLYGTDYGLASTNVTIEGNTFEFNGSAAPADPANGIRFRAGLDASTITVRDNAFIDGGAQATALAVRHQGTGDADASGNWWGSNDPAGVNALANGGTLVDYTPWLDTGTDNRPGIGFEGDFSALHVDDDSPQTGIVGIAQEGIDLVDGSTVYIHDGTYEEQLDIGKDLVLQGDGLGTEILSPDLLALSWATSKDYRAIIYIHDADAEIRDITLNGAGKGNANTGFLGVGFRNAGGGIYDCDILDIRNTPFSGAQYGVGISSWNDDLTSRSIDVHGCTLTGFQKNAMALNADVTTGLAVDVRGNTITGAGATTVTAQNGVQVYGDIATGTIADNVISGIAYDNTADVTKWVATSILNYYADVDITGNTITAAHMGIYNIDGAGLISENDLTIEKIGVYAFGIIGSDPPKAVPSPAGMDDMPVGSSRPFDGAPLALLDVDILDNVVTFTGPDNTATFGIEVDAGWGPNDLDATINGNIVTGFEVGIEVYTCESGCAAGIFTAVDARFNGLFSNTLAVRSNVDTITVDASGNWLGSNVPAALIAGTLDYTPWLDVGTDMSTDIGFQGDFSALHVDDDSPQTGLVGIVQEGIDMVDGSTVYIHDGTYEEQLEITSDLVLQGDGAGTVILSPDALPLFFTTGTLNNYPVVYIHDTDDVEINDLTVDGAGKGNANYRFLGIGYRNAGGGVYDCSILGIMDTPFSGAQHGVAMYLYNDDLTTRSIDVHGTTITGFQKNAMALNAERTTPLAVDVRDNIITGAGETGVTAQNGIQVSAALGTGDIEDNVISGIAYNGGSWVATSILSYYGVHAIDGNTITGSHMGIYNIDGAGTISGNDVEVEMIGGYCWGIVASDPPKLKPSPFVEEEAPLTSGRDMLKAPLAVLDVDVIGNTVTNVGTTVAGTYGIEADAGYGPDDLDITISYNTVCNFEAAIEFWVCQSTCDTGVFTSAVANYNYIGCGNTYGIRSNADYLMVDGTNNWWGDASGPYHATLNPTGTGDAVSDYVDFDPWLGAPNQLSVVPAYGTTNCLDPITYTFWLDHVGVDEVRGIDVTFQVDGAVVSVGNVSTDIVEGSYLPGIGGTTFFALDNGGGEYQISTSILGGTTGATGSGDLFTVVFTPVAEGLSAITITDLKVRDVNNVPLSVAMVDGEVRIDCTGPTMEPIAEAEGVCYNVAPTFANFGFDDDQALDWAEYQIDADGWVTIFTGIDVPEWNDDGWALPGFAGLSEGSHTVYFRVADMAGNENGEGTPDTYSWSFIKDTVPPAAPSGFSAMPGHNKVHLAWTNPTGDASFVGVEIRLVAWGDYPQYITAPSYPADHLGGTFVTQVPGESFDDDPRAPRDIYYYAAFSYDCAGNYSVFDAGAADRSTSYWLGDIFAGYDGLVNFNDLGDFSNAFGSTEGGGGGWIAEADFGPTDDWSRFGIPLPDDAIDFEDLMIFSMNYGNVDPLGFDFVPEERSTENLENMVAFDLVPTTTDAGTIVSIMMSSRASTLKGARLVIETGDGCEIVNISKGDAVATRGDVFFGTIPSFGGMEVCLSALGVDKPLAGSGEVAKILVKSEGSINVSLAEADIRDIENRQFVLEGTGSYEGPEVPIADALNQNFPNPFNPATTVAFDLAKPASVRIGIYDVSGRLVRTLIDRSMEAGSHEVGWNGTNNMGTGVPSGMYFYRMTTSDGFTATRKMILLR